MESPLTQFTVKTLIPLSWGGVDLSLTNSAFMMLISVGVILGFSAIALHRWSLIPTSKQSIVEMIFDLVQNIAGSNLGPEAVRFFPFIFSLFTFILIGNLCGLIPYFFTFTGQLILTFGLASLVFILVTLVGIMRHGLGFLRNFMPAGVPLFLAPILIPVELISYLSRPISLSIRLFANMMAGHTMLKVFAIFTGLLGLYGISTIFVNILLIGFEFLVAFLQAYVFSVLACLYLKDALDSHT